MSRAEDTSIQLCRLCLRNTTGCISVYSNIVEADDRELPKMVKHCVGVEIRRGDGFTCMICGPCHKMVLKFYDFKSTCLESQWRLKSMPRWAAEGPRDPLEGTEEVDMVQKKKQTTAKQATDVVMNEAPKPSSAVGNVDESRPPIWPVCVWTMSEGCWRASASSNEEMVISDPLDEGMNAAAAKTANRVEERAVSPSVDEDSDRMADSPTLEASYVDHTYSTQPTEPLQLCSVVMDNLDDEDDNNNSSSGGGVKVEGGQENAGLTAGPMQLQGEEGSRSKNVVVVKIKGKEVGVLKRVSKCSPGDVPKCFRLVSASDVKDGRNSMSVLRQNTGSNVISLSRERTLGEEQFSWQANQRPLLPKQSGLQDGVINGRVISAKLSDGKIILRNNGSEEVHRIVVQRNGVLEAGKHIPMVKGLRLTSGLMIPESAKCSLLKVKRVNR